MRGYGTAAGAKLPVMKLSDLGGGHAASAAWGRVPSSAPPLRRTKGVVVGKEDDLPSINGIIVPCLLETAAFDPFDAVAQRGPPYRRRLPILISVLLHRDHRRMRRGVLCR